jgi:hypothetical protein
MIPATARINTIIMSIANSEIFRCLNTALAPLTKNSLNFAQGIAPFILILERRN